MSSTSKEQIAPFTINSDNSKKKVALFQKFLNEKDVVRSCPEILFDILSIRLTLPPVNNKITKLPHSAVCNYHYPSEPALPLPDEAPAPISFSDHLQRYGFPAPNVLSFP